MTPDGVKVSGLLACPTTLLCAHKISSRESVTRLCICASRAEETKKLFLFTGLTRAVQRLLLYEEEREEGNTLVPLKRHQTFSLATKRFTLSPHKQGGSAKLR